MFLFSDCAKKTENKTNDCEALADAAATASTAFVSNPTEATCQAYVQAIHDYYTGCDLIPDATKQAYDAWLASADCSFYSGGK